MESKKLKFGRVSIISLVIIIVIAVCVVALIGIIIFNSFKITDNASKDYANDILGEENIEYDNNAKVNNSDLLIENKYLDNFIFSNYYIYSVDGNTRIEYDITNDSDKRMELDEYVMEIYSGEKKVGQVTCKGTTLAAKQTKTLNVVIKADVANLSNIMLKKIYNKSV